MKRFKSISAKSGPNESAWDVLKQHAEENPKLSMAPSTAETGLSKRAERKVHIFYWGCSVGYSSEYLFYFLESPTGPSTATP